MRHKYQASKELNQLVDWAVPGRAARCLLANSNEMCGYFVSKKVNV